VAGQGGRPDALHRTGVALGERLQRVLLTDELLEGEIFYTLQEARTVIEWRRLEYNHFRPHSSLGYRAPAPEAERSLCDPRT